MGSVIPRKKVLISRHSEVYGRVNSEARNGRKWHSCSSKQKRQHSERISESFLLFLFHGTEFQVVFSSAEWFGKEFQVFASIFVPRNGIPSCLLFRGMVQNRIPRVGFLFCSMVQNSEHFSPLLNDSERNSESFLFRGTAGIPPEQTNCSVHSVFRGIILFVGNCQAYTATVGDHYLTFAFFSTIHFGFFGFGHLSSIAVHVTPPPPPSLSSG
jgi:hypothetical protein